VRADEIWLEFDKEWEGKKEGRMDEGTRYDCMQVFLLLTL
jgi:hypothetical protein